MEGQSTGAAAGAPPGLPPLPAVEGSAGDGASLDTFHELEADLRAAKTQAALSQQQHLEAEERAGSLRKALLAAMEQLSVMQQAIESRALKPAGSSDRGALVPSLSGKAKRSAAGAAGEGLCARNRAVLDALTRYVAGVPDALGALEELPSATASAAAGGGGTSSGFSSLLERATSTFRGGASQVGGSGGGAGGGRSAALGPSSLLSSALSAFGGVRGSSGNATAAGGGHVTAGETDGEGELPSGSEAGSDDESASVTGGGGGGGGGRGSVVALALGSEGQEGSRGRHATAAANGNDEEEPEARGGEGGLLPPSATAAATAAAAAAAARKARRATARQLLRVAACTPPRRATAAETVLQDPVRALPRIFAYLSAADVASAMGVCRAWRAAPLRAEGELPRQWGRHGGMPLALRGALWHAAVVAVPAGPTPQQAQSSSGTAQAGNAGSTGAAAGAASGAPSSSNTAPSAAPGATKLALPSSAASGSGAWAVRAPTALLWSPGLISRALGYLGIRAVVGYTGSLQEALEQQQPLAGGGAQAAGGAPEGPATGELSPPAYCPCIEPLPMASSKDGPAPAPAAALATVTAPAALASRRASAVSTGVAAVYGDLSSPPSASPVASPPSSPLRLTKARHASTATTTRTAAPVQLHYRRGTYTPPSLCPHMPTPALVAAASARLQAHLARTEATESGNSSAPTEAAAAEPLAAAWPRCGHPGCSPRSAGWLWAPRRRFRARTLLKLYSLHDAPPSSLPALLPYPLGPSAPLPELPPLAQRVSLVPFLCRAAVASKGSKQLAITSGSRASTSTGKGPSSAPGATTAARGQLRWSPAAVVAAWAGYASTRATQAAAQPQAPSAAAVPALADAAPAKGTAALTGSVPVAATAVAAPSAAVTVAAPVQPAERRPPGSRTRDPSLRWSSLPAPLPVTFQPLTDAEEEAAALTAGAAPVSLPVGPPGGGGGGGTNLVEVPFAAIGELEALPAPFPGTPLSLAVSAQPPLPAEAIYQGYVTAGRLSQLASEAAAIVRSLGAEVRAARAALQKRLEGGRAQPEAISTAARGLVTAEARLLVASAAASERIYAAHASCDAADVACVTALLDARWSHALDLCRAWWHAATGAAGDAPYLLSPVSGKAVPGQGVSLPPLPGAASSSRQQLLLSCAYTAVKTWTTSTSSSSSGSNTAAPANSTATDAPTSTSAPASAVEPEAPFPMELLPSAAEQPAAPTVLTVIIGGIPVSIYSDGRPVEEAKEEQDSAKEGGAAGGSPGAADAAAAAAAATEAAPSQSQAPMSFVPLPCSPADAASGRDCLVPLSDNPASSATEAPLLPHHHPAPSYNPEGANGGVPAQLPLPPRLQCLLRLAGIFDRDDAEEEALGLRHVQVLVGSGVSVRRGTAPPVSLGAVKRLYYALRGPTSCSASASTSAFAFPADDVLRSAALAAGFSAVVDCTAASGATAVSLGPAVAGLSLLPPPPLQTNVSAAEAWPRLTAPFPASGAATEATGAGGGGGGGGIANYPAVPPLLPALPNLLALAAEYGLSPSGLSKLQTGWADPEARLQRFLASLPPAPASEAPPPALPPLSRRNSLVTPSSVPGSLATPSFVLSSADSLLSGGGGATPGAFVSERGGAASAAPTPTLGPAAAPGIGIGSRRASLETPLCEQPPTLQLPGGAGGEGSSRTDAAEEGSTATPLGSGEGAAAAAPAAAPSASGNAASPDTHSLEASSISLSAFVADSGSGNVAVTLTQAPKLPLPGTRAAAAVPPLPARAPLSRRGSLSGLPLLPDGVDAPSGVEAPAAWTACHLPPLPYDSPHAVIVADVRRTFGDVERALTRKGTNGSSGAPSTAVGGTGRKASVVSLASTREPSGSTADENELALLPLAGEPALVRLRAQELFPTTVFAGVVVSRGQGAGPSSSSSAAGGGDDTARAAEEGETDPSAPASSSSSPNEWVTLATVSVLRQRLWTVLSAYAAFDRCVSYTQGMNFLSSMALRHMPARHAWWTLAGLCHSPLHRFAEVFGAGLPRVRFSFEVVSSLVASQLPSLSEHLSREGVQPDMYIPGWVMTLFSSLDTLPLPYVAALWDAALGGSEGWKPVYRSCLALLDAVAPDLRLSDFASIVRFLHAYPKHRLPPQPLAFLRRGLRFKVSHRELASRYAAFKEAARAAEAAAAAAGPAGVSAASGAAADATEAGASAPGGEAPAAPAVPAAAVARGATPLLTGAAASAAALAAAGSPALGAGAGGSLPAGLDLGPSGTMPLAAPVAVLAGGGGGGGMTLDELEAGAAGSSPPARAAPAPGAGFVPIAASLSGSRTPSPVPSPLPIASPTTAGQAEGFAPAAGGGPKGSGAAGTALGDAPPAARPGTTTTASGVVIRDVLTVSRGPAATRVEAVTNGADVLVELPQPGGSGASGGAGGARPAIRSMSFFHPRRPTASSSSSSDGVGGLSVFPLPEASDFDTGELPAALFGERASTASVGSGSAPGGEGASVAGDSGGDAGVAAAHGGAGAVDALALPQADGSSSDTKAQLSVPEVTTPASVEATPAAAPSDSVESVPAPEPVAAPVPALAPAPAPAPAAPAPGVLLVPRTDILEFDYGAGAPPAPVVAVPVAVVAEEATAPLPEPVSQPAGASLALAEPAATATLSSWEVLGALPAGAHTSEPAAPELTPASSSAAAPLDPSSVFAAFAHAYGTSPLVKKSVSVTGPESEPAATSTASARLDFGIAFSGSGGGDRGTESTVTAPQATLAPAPAAAPPRPPSSAPGSRRGSMDGGAAPPLPAASIFAGGLAARPPQPPRA